MKTLPVTPDTFGVDLRSRVKSVYKASVKFHRTIGGEMGVKDDELDPIPSRGEDNLNGTPTSLYTGTRQLSLGSSYLVDSDVIVEQNDPLPIQLLSIVYEVDVSSV
jgi:hypothetical protein